MASRHNLPFTLSSPNGLDWSEADSDTFECPLSHFPGCEAD